MSTKNPKDEITGRNVRKSDLVSETILGAKAVIPSRTADEYRVQAGKKGNPLLVRAADTKVYANARANGTTAVILAVLAASGRKPDASGLVDGAALSEGYDALKKGNYGSDLWKRLEGIYGTIPGNRSASPALKLGPVVSALAREHRSGYLRGFDIPNIGSPELRTAFGFTK